jgi:predicted regulator of Ras-like GTPase activity (Roadblock/LC7/MglB family)
MFKEFLKDLVVSVDGAVGSVIMGMDGIAVDEYGGRADTDLQLIGTELSSLVKDMNRASASMESGSVGEALFVTEKRSLIVRAINEEYFAVLVLNGKGNLGKGRFKLRTLVPKIAKEFA